ncbi:MAG: hypothetical protein ACI4C5_01430 [Lachnospiraceae bacterium]
MKVFASGTETVTVTFSFADAGKNVYSLGDIFLNDERMAIGSDSATGNNGYALGSGSTNTLKIYPGFGETLVSVKVNGNIYTPAEGEDLITISNLEPAADYAIEEITFASNQSNDITIIWAYDLAAFWGGDYNPNDAGQAEVLVEHGKVEIVSVNGSSSISGARIDETGGWVPIKKGDDVVLKLIPDYGYQLSSVTINGETMIPQSGVSTFALNNIQSNLHFSGAFVKNADTISTAGSNTVASAGIANGANAAASGNLSLTVTDNSSYDTAKAQNLVEGAESAQAVDLTLEQIVSKGNGENWESNITEFSNPITLSLGIEDYDSDYEYEVVRNHDGVLTKLPAKMSDGTISFDTNQFSTYIIVKAKKADTNQKSVSKQVNLGEGAPTVTIKNSTSELLDMIELTEEEQEAIKNGADVNIIFNVSKITPNDEELALIQSVSDDKTIGQYLDINLTLKIEGMEERQITDLSDEINIIITMPDELLNSVSTKERTYYLVHVHNKEASVINGTYDSDNKQFTFKTDGFSTYAIVYKEIDKSSDLQQTSVQKSGTPKTGDMNMPEYWFMLMLVAGIGVVISGVKGRKLKKER